METDMSSSLLFYVIQLIAKNAGYITYRYQPAISVTCHRNCRLVAPPALKEQPLS
jgi:hypothetical protein